jgi:hypothetical protein
LAAQATPAISGVLEGNCRIADQPAATLLIPYFEVDLDDASGPTTLISVNNASSRPALSRVVLWTDWGVPTLAFDVYLTGYDVQTLNIRDLFQGTLPVTGAGISNVGQLSEEGAGFPGCDSGAAIALDAAEQSNLRAAHTGQPYSANGTQQCAGSFKAATSLATGYITVDSVNRCTPRTLGTLVNTPAHALYFAEGGKGLASNANVLWGDFFYVDSRRNRAESQSAVPLVADADFFEPGDYTFYGRYVGFDSRDNRAPLSSLYYVRYMEGGPFSGGTDLIVWRDNREPAVEPAACGTAPDWSPMGELQLVVFDEEENPVEIPESNAFPLASQKLHVGSPALPADRTFGWIMLDLWHSDSTHAQGWVGVTMSAEGRYSTGHQAIRADDLCNFGP